MSHVQVQVLNYVCQHRSSYISNLFSVCRQMGTRKIEDHKDRGPQRSGTTKTGTRKIRDQKDGGPKRSGTTKMGTRKIRDQKDRGPQRSGLLHSYRRKKVLFLFPISFYYWFSLVICSASAKPSLSEVLATKCIYLNNECGHYMEHPSLVAKLLVLAHWLR